eukprot:COSAG01_NODE_1183_length_11346_cov_263.800302_10_plen_46_part_00
MKNLSAYIRSKGLKFGICPLQPIPQQSPLDTTPVLLREPDLALIS